MRWHTGEIQQLISTVTGCSTRTAGRIGGDYDTNAVYVDIPGSEDHLSVTGFHTMVATNDIDDKECEFIELRNAHSDSRGGCQSSNPAVHAAYGQIKAALTQRGWDVADHYNERF